MQTSGLSDSTKGIFNGVGAFIMWGGMPLFWLALGNVPALEVLLMRILCSFLFMLVIFMFLGGLKASIAILKQPKHLALLFCTSTLLASNWLLYIWAIQAGYVLETSLGYFINPMLNVVLAFFFLKERPSRLAWFAIALAASGVLYQIVLLGQVPFIALWLAGSFAIYGLLHKKSSVEAIPGLCIETLVHTPTVIIALIWLHLHGGLSFLSGNIWQWSLLISTGPITTIPLIMFTYAAQRIPLTTIGLLQYLAPSIVFLLGIFMFGEEMTMDRIITFGSIWVAIAIYSFDLIMFQHKLATKK